MTIGAGVVNLRERRLERATENAAGAGGLAAAWNVWEAGCSAAVGPRTLKSYRCAVTRAIAAGVTEPSRLQIGKWRDTLVRDGLSVATVNWVVRSVRAVVEGADDLATDGSFAPLARAWRHKRLREPERLPRCPPRDVLVRLARAEALRHKGELAFVWLAGTTGLRKQELLGLLVTDYDKRDRRLIVHQQRHAQHRKNRKAHVCILAEPVCWFVAWAQEHRAEMMPRRGPRAEALDRYLFPWGESYVSDMMRRIRAELGPEADTYFPPGTAWHAFRHLMASEVARNTRDPFAVMESLGDSTLTMATCYCKAVRGSTEASAAATTRSLLDDRLLQGEFEMGGAGGVTQRDRSVTPPAPKKTKPAIQKKLVAGFSPRASEDAQKG